MNRKNLLKKGGIALATIAIVIAGAAAFSAFEAHVINVTARIENALSVPTDPINFGTVFPQEELDRQFTVALSQSFLDEPRVDDVAYFLRQKPKCAITSNNGQNLVGPTATGHVVPLGGGEYRVDCGEAPRQLTTGESWGVLPLLCPYLSKHELTEDGQETENDGTTLAFHEPFVVGTSTITWFDTPGRLAKSAPDTEDIWNLDLKVPCFGDHCAQDWESFVLGINPNVDPDDYIQPIENEHKVFGCDLWIEVSGVSESEEPEPRETVGAALSSYDDPGLEVCDAVVETTESIQAVSDSASDGDVVCVDPSYDGTGDTYPITLDTPNLTLAGLGSAGDANIPGGIFLNESGITITGLEFTGYDHIQASANAAIYIHNEEGVSGVALSNTTISNNIFTAPGGAKGDEAKAIITEIGSAVTPVATGIDIFHNVFDGWRQAMFFNTASGYEVAFNDILNNDVGVANDGPHNASIHNNDFEGNVLEAVGVASSASNGTGNNGLLVVNTNNLAPAGAGNNVNWYGVSVQGGADVDATGNWWDGEAEGDRTNNTSEVDTSSPEALAFPEN